MNFHHVKKILLLNATKTIREEMLTLKKDIHEQITLLKNRFEDVSYRFVKQTQTYQIRRKVEIQKVSNRTLSIQVLFRNILSFLALRFYSIIQKVSKFWRKELLLIIDLVENKYLKNQNIRLRRKRVSISVQWISCLIFSYPDLGQEQSLVYPDLAFVSSLQFCSCSVRRNSSSMEIYVVKSNGYVYISRIEKSQKPTKHI